MDLETLYRVNEVNQKEKNKTACITCMWNLRRWYRLTYLQGGNGDTDVEDRRVNAGLWGKGVERMERSGLTCIHDCEHS